MLPAGVEAGTTYTTTTVSIEDNDNPLIKVGFKEATYSVSEGDFIEIMLQLTAPPERLITIKLESTIDTTASSDDYTVEPVEVAFAKTATTAIVRFTAANDSFNDDGEVVELEPDLGLPNRVSLGDNFTTIVTIVDTDVPAVSIATASGTVVEGTAVTFTLSRPMATAGAALDVTVDVSESGDVVAMAGEGEKTVSFDANETTATLTVATVADTAYEDNSGVTAAIQTGDGYTISGGAATRTVTDDDFPVVHRRTVGVARRGR